MASTADFTHTHARTESRVARALHRRRRNTGFLIALAALDALLFAAGLILVIMNQGHGADVTTDNTAGILGVAFGISAAVIGGVLALLQAVRSSR